MVSFIRISLKLLGAVILLVIAAGIAVYASNPTKYGRLVTSFSNFPASASDTSWWEPKAIVKGIPNPEPIPVAAEDARTIKQDALDAVVAWADDKGTIALVVSHQGVIQLEHYWPGYDASTASNTSSMHKSIVGLMFGFALADGDIKSLDEPIASYVPEWRMDARGSITIRQVLQMSSGLKTDQMSFNPLSRTVEFMFGTDLVSAVLATDLESEPGSEFQYNSANAQLAGIILERATGKKLADYESEKLWQPLGAADAFLWLDHTGGMAQSYCCFNTTAREWLRLGFLLASGGTLGHKRIIEVDWLRQVITPSATNPNYGFFTWLGNDLVGERPYHRRTSFSARHDEPMAADDIFFFDGAIGNRLYVIPSKELVIVRTGTFNQNWEETFLPNTIIRGLIE